MLAWPRPDRFLRADCHWIANCCTSSQVSRPHGVSLKREEAAFKAVAHTLGTKQEGDFPYLEMVGAKLDAPVVSREPPLPLLPRPLMRWTFVDELMGGPSLEGPWLASPGCPTLSASVLCPATGKGPHPPGQFWAPLEWVM